MYIPHTPSYLIPMESRSTFEMSTEAGGQNGLKTLNFHCRPLTFDTSLCLTSEKNGVWNRKMTARAIVLQCPPIEPTATSLLGELLREWSKLSVQQKKLFLIQYRRSETVGAQALLPAPALEKMIVA